MIAFVRLLSGLGLLQSGHSWTSRWACGGTKLTVETAPGRIGVFPRVSDFFSTLFAIVHLGFFPGWALWSQFRNSYLIPECNWISLLHWMFLVIHCKKNDLDISESSQVIAEMEGCIPACRGIMVTASHRPNHHHLGNSNSSLRHLCSRHPVGFIGSPCWFAWLKIDLPACVRLISSLPRVGDSNGFHTVRPVWCMG